MTEPWLTKGRRWWECHTGINDIEVCCGANEWITVSKIYGPLCASDVRVRLEYDNDRADWVVECMANDDWEEKARWGCQEGFPDDEEGD